MVALMGAEMSALGDCIIMRQMAYLLIGQPTLQGFIKNVICPELSGQRICG